MGVMILLTNQRIAVGLDPLFVIQFSSGWYPKEQVAQVALQGSLFKGTI